MSVLEDTLPPSTPTSPRTWLSCLPQKPLERDYVRHEQVGKGTFGAVFRCCDKAAGVDRAVKVVDLTRMKGAAMSDLEAEVRLQSNQSWEHTVVTVDAFTWGNSLYIVQEFASGGDLMAAMLTCGNFSDAAAAGIIHQLLKAVFAMHSCNIVHRDIKPSNILLTKRQRLSRTSPFIQGSILLADFGFAAECGERMVLDRTCGTPLYMAPEVVRKQGHGKQVDLWSVGITAYVLLSGSSPFEADDVRDLFRKTVKGAYRPMTGSHWKNVSAEAKDFIARCLILDPLQRITAAAALKHPWIARVSLQNARQRLRVAFHAVRANVRLMLLHRRRLQSTGLQVIDLSNKWAERVDDLPATLRPGLLEPLGSGVVLPCERKIVGREQRTASAPPPYSPKTSKWSWKLWPRRASDDLSLGANAGMKWLVLWDNEMETSSEWTVVECL